MRPLPLTLLLALAACGSPDAPPPEPPPEAEPRALRVEIDSVTARDVALNYDVAVAYPQIVGSDAPAVARVNRAIRDSLAAFLDGIRPRPADFTGNPEMDLMIIGEAEGGPARTFLGERVFSSRVDVYAYTGGAHGNTFSFPLTYDLATGEPIRLRALFRNGTAWPDTLSALTTARLAAQQDTSWLFEDQVPAAPSTFAFFTLGADSLTVFFPPYAIAPYAAGASEVTLPYTALRSVLSPSGPVEWLLADD
jgi:hypothetical protein